MTMKMKKKVQMIFAALAVVALLASCEKVVDALNIDFKTGTTTIDFAIDPMDAGKHVFAEKVLTSDLKEEVEKQGGSLSDIDHVKTESAKVSIVAGAENFDMLESIELWVKDPTLGELRIAYSDDISPGQTTIDLLLEDINLLDYTKQEEYTVVAKGTLLQAIEEKIDLKGELRFEVQL